jgi:hypothetical protein
MIHTGIDKDNSPLTRDNYTPSTFNQQDQRDRKKQKNNSVTRKPRTDPLSNRKKQKQSTRINKE